MFDQIDRGHPKIDIDAGLCGLDVIQGQTESPAASHML